MAFRDEAGDAAIVRYREYLKGWEKQGWRIDWQTVQQIDGKSAWAIPCPARRESGNGFDPDFTDT
ncbi:MAG: hypothetical protein E2O52_05695 [Gammaproteobacteria bacterium]|nr:MAG: hypothetical protein E2O52_05695 [Gammaproteobacteria bacterium]